MQNKDIKLIYIHTWCFKVIGKFHELIQEPKLENNFYQYVFIYTQMTKLIQEYEIAKIGS